MTRLRNLLKASLLSSLLLVAVYADGAENGSKPVQVKIGTILASNESDQFDARLKPMERQLKVMKFRGTIVPPSKFPAVGRLPSRLKTQKISRSL
jgi:hypothetical protein